MRILLVVDGQVDFMPGGALPVPEGNEIVPVINSIRDKFDQVIWTRDWHPVNHCSFKENGGPWPKHCVQGTPGAELHKDLIVKPYDIIILKGTDPAIDSYSGFYDNERKKTTDLVDIMKDLSQKSFIQSGESPHIIVAGLATNFCVMYTVRDALREGYETTVILDACKGINVTEGAVWTAVENMMDAGAFVTTSKGILGHMRK
jgi:nicotinamidase/pyrazinamidase